jgi:histidinol-phosphate aminotransferase
MYRIVSEQRGARVVEVPRHGPNSGFTIDIAGIAKAARGASLVWLCEPNNPTGTYDPPERIAKLLEALMNDAVAGGLEPPTVAMDEAYAEFVGRSVLPFRSDYPKLVVVRTLSKAHALAGARVGFAVARPETLGPIVAYRAPASVGTISAALATASLRRPELSAANVTRIAVQRSRLFLDLADLGWRPYPSSANFMLAQFGDSETASRAGDALLRKGLVPRTFGTDHPLANCIRLTVRSEQENDRLIEAVRGIKL